MHDFDFGTGDFTVEMWVYPNATSGFMNFLLRKLEVALAPTAGHAGINIYNGIGELVDLTIGSKWWQ